jgi:carbamate kinase
MSQRTIVIALGGNALVRADQDGTVDEQFANLRQTSEQILGLLDSENRVVITHGNGPQVGNLLLCIEANRDIVPPLSLDICGAATQGLMGYMIQQIVANTLREKGLKHNITTVLTQVLVDEDDPAFASPSKPIGPFYDLEETQKLRREQGWEIVEDAQRGYRRVVASPAPVDIQQTRIIQDMLDNGEIVIAVGGGGVPVVRDKTGGLRGIEAVIDKDLASACLAINIEAETFLLLTSVEKVSRDFGRPSQKALDNLTVDEAEALLAEGHFGKGSMEPKIMAGMKFLRESKNHAQRQVIITLPETATAAMQGKTGTRMTL